VNLIDEISNEKCEVVTWKLTTS